MTKSKALTGSAVKVLKREIGCFDSPSETTANDDEDNYGDVRRSSVTPTASNVHFLAHISIVAAVSYRPAPPAAAERFPSATKMRAASSAATAPPAAT